MGKGGELVKKRRKRGSTNVTNSKQKNQKKVTKGALSIKGQGTPADLNKRGDKDEGGSWRGRCKMRS